jgi:hypothetical protein
MFSVQELAIKVQSCATDSTPKECPTNPAVCGTNADVTILRHGNCGWQSPFLNFRKAGPLLKANSVARRRRAPGSIPIH